MNEAPTSINQVKINFWLNGKSLDLQVEPEMTALELLHEKLRLYGSKSSCNEGDCGACTVIVAQEKDHRVVYQTFNSCIYPAVRLHGKHLITVEGITTGDELHPVQRALLVEHGTQCGFCTPGFVMSILGLYLNNPHPSEAEILAALEGNLCRCTGYDSIMKAAHLAAELVSDQQNLLPSAIREVERSLLSFTTDYTAREVENREGWNTEQYLTPRSLNELWDIMDVPKVKGHYKYISGGTDLMVAANIQHIHYPYLIDLCQVTELNGIYITDSSVYIGANTTMTELLQSEVIASHVSVLTKVLSLMASAQIRNAATLAGNIANASPVADGATTLLALDASVALASRHNTRTVRLSEFYHSYKQTALKPDEVLKAIIIPFDDSIDVFSDVIKSAKRKAVDISSVISVINISQTKGKITSARLSFGGVAPYPVLAAKTMAFLAGREIDQEWFEEAAEMAQSEFTPISDIRGREEYRSILIRNHVLKHLMSLSVWGESL